MSFCIITCSLTFSMKTIETMCDFSSNGDFIALPTSVPENMVALVWPAQKTNKQRGKKKNRSWSVLHKTASLITPFSSSTKLITGRGNGLSVCKEDCMAT